MSPHASSRRTVLKQLGLVGVGLSIADFPGWVLPALAQGETQVPFTDIPDNVRWEVPPDRRTLDLRTINGPFTPKDQFFTTQHYGHPDVDAATYKLKVTGLVKQTKSFSLDDLKRMGGKELIAGFECSGNRGPLSGLSGNAKWTGLPLKTVLDAAGVEPAAREFVFFGADHGTEDIEWRTQKFTLEQNFGRSLPRDKALGPDLFLAYALNGDPLTKHQGAPLRLLVPGYYGVCNVKWLNHIHLQEEQYLGRFQARWYRTLRGEMIDGELMWKESAVMQMNLKSFIARVTQAGTQYKVLGVVLNDGSPIKSVEVKVDDGPWQAATLDPATAKDKYSWKLFTYNWNGATPGEHTLVSRVTDAAGHVQPTAKDLENKKSFLEENSQVPRKVKI
jgi:DMSO/TMAO reductase YedYZ molybdopterin-dependent catalytic subunit